MARSRRPASLLVEVDAYRATSYDVPFWAGPNRRSGRWNVADHGCTQYLCLDADAPWAELLRHNDLRTEADAAMLVTTLWQVRVADQPVADYGDFEKAEGAGFPPDALIDDDHARCRSEATRLAGLGFRGVLSPSAALPGSRSLTLFGPRVKVPWTTTVRTASTLPAQPLATGHPPPGLVRRVRFRGLPHAGYAAYRAQRERSAG
jgi:hypothetical protein